VTCGNTARRDKRRREQRVVLVSLVVSVVLASVVTPSFAAVHPRSMCGSRSRLGLEVYAGPACVWMLRMPCRRYSRYALASRYRCP
jgi:hypothetical protein